MITLAPDGVEIAFEVIGRGSPLVLLHGFASKRESWRDLGYADAFTASGYRVILMDVRGHGRSGRPQELSAYTQMRRACDVIAVLDALGVASANIFGFSMGAWVGIGAAQGYPDRVKCLMTCGGHCFAQSLQPFRDALADDMTGWLAVLEKLIRRPASEKLRAQVLANDIDALRLSVCEDRKDTSAAFKKAAVPLLAIAGTNDPLYGDIARFAARCSGILLPIQGRNHLTSFMAVNAVATACVKFLQDHDTNFEPERGDNNGAFDHAVRHSQGQTVVAARGLSLQKCSAL